VAVLQAVIPDIAVKTLKLGNIQSASFLLWPTTLIRTKGIECKMPEWASRASDPTSGFFSLSLSLSASKIHQSCVNELAVRNKDRTGLPVKNKN
jgi:hypothetical protein